MASEFGRYLRSLREAQGWTQEQASERSEVPQTTLSSLETGAALRTSDANMAKLARAYGVSRSTLYANAGIIEGLPGASTATAPRTIVLPTRDGEQEFDLDVVIAYVENKPDRIHQERLSRWRRTLQREDYERIVAKIYVAWSSNADLLLSGLETISGPEIAN